MRQFLFTLAAIACAVAVQAQTIQEIQGEQASSPYLDQTVTTSGIVTAVAPDGFFIQDGEGGWSGLYVYDPSGTAPDPGDEVSVSATVDEYYEMTELVSVSNIEVISTGNTLPDPVVLTTGECADEQYESVFIRVENAACSNSDLGFNEFELNDGSGPIAVNDLMYLFAADQGVEYNVQGPLFYSFEAYKIEPRDENDIETASPLYFTVLPEEFDLTTESMTIEWETNAASNSVIEWGLTPDYELFTITESDEVTEHSIALDDLQPARVYYLRIHSENNEGMTSLHERVVCTVSESSGDINVYFNHEVDTSVATTSEATHDENITATIIDYINMAQNTLDITMYDMNEAPQSIFDAINARYDAGVTVRFITDEEPENPALDWLNAGINVVAGNFVGIMHDKFLVIDAEDTDNAWVMTGSMNWTGANLGWDYNNVICIQDESLAATYTLEFNEMWGSDLPTPDAFNAAFGEFKTDDTPHKFVIGGSDVECYFSPTDGTPDAIYDAIVNTEDNLVFAMMVFTENSLGNAVTLADVNGASVSGIIDYVEFNGSEFDLLVGEGLAVVDYQNEDGSQWPDGPTLHHKYAIGDFQTGSENPWVITGSHNWTASAGSINDENTLIIYNHEVANWYFQEYIKRYTELTVSIDEKEELDLNIYPNPTVNELQFKSNSVGNYQLVDSNGKLIMADQTRTGINTLTLGHLSTGVYTLTVIDGTVAYTVQVLKQ